MTDGVGAPDRDLANVAPIDHRSRVAVIKDGIAHLQKITIARDLGTEVEVHDGVKPGDQVILNPMVNLAEGSKVAARGPKTS